MTDRRILPVRRRAETFNLDWGGFNRGYAVTVGYYSDNSLGEVFITGGKSGEQVEAIARDGAVLLSLALQHGTPLESIAGAITRDSAGAPSSIIGAVVDRLTAESPPPNSEPSDGG